MKLAYLTSRYPAISHAFILREVQALRQLGIEVHTFTVRRPNSNELLATTDREESRRTYAILPAWPGRLVCAHLKMLLLRPYRYLGALWMALRSRPPGLRAAIWHLFYFGEAAILASELRRRGIRHVHVHFANVSADVAMLASQISGGTWSMTLHGLCDFENPSLVRLDEKIRRAQFVICVSDFGRAQTMLHSEPAMWDKIHRVHCGIDVDRYARRDEQKERAESQPIRLLNVARLAPEKGHTVLLRSIQSVLSQGIEITCTFVGGEGECRPLERLAEELGIFDHVRFVGAVGQDRIQQYYDSSDIFVLPSLAEGLPVVLMEAMAKGLPVIASHIMGIPELVEHGVNGLLVPPGRVQPLAEAISQLAKDPDLRCRMGNRGRDKVCREFDVSLAGEQLSKIFSQIGLGTPARQSPGPNCERVGALGA